MLQESKAKAESSLCRDFFFINYLKKKFPNPKVSLHSGETSIKIKKENKRIEESLKSYGSHS